METHFSKETSATTESFIFGIGKDGDRFARAMLGQIMASNNFQANTLGPIGGIVEVINDVLAVLESNACLVPYIPIKST